MLAEGEDDSSIQFVVDDFKSKYEQQAVAKPEPSFVEKTADFLGMGGLAKGIRQAAFLNFDPSGKDLVKRLRDGSLTQEEFDYAIGGLASPKEVIGSAAQTGLNIATAGMGVSKAPTALGRIAGNTARSAAIGGGLSAGSALERDGSLEDVVSSAAKGAAVSGVVGFGVGGLGELGKFLTSQTARESLVNRGLAIPKKVVEKGKSPAGRFLNEGTGLTKRGILAEAEKTISEVEAKIGAKLASKTGTAGTAGVIQDIRKSLGSYYEGALGGEDIERIIGSLPIDSLRKNQELTFIQLNKLRQIIDNKFLGNGKWLNTTTSENVTALKAASNAIRTLVKSGDQELQDLFSRYADAITTKTSLSSDLAKPHMLTMLLELLGSGLYGTIAGGGINPESAAKSAAAFAAMRGLSSTPAKILTARTLGKVAELGQNQGIKTVGRVATQNLIKQ